MSVQTLDIGEPFFTLRLLGDEISYKVDDKSIVVNLSTTPIRILDQSLESLQSVVLHNVVMEHIDHAAIIERFADHADEAALLKRIRQSWPSAYEKRGEERLKGIEHYMSPKQWVGQYGFTFYHSASVPLNVGLHRDHAFCPVPGFREIHTQIVGFGKMQQCRQKDVATLYLEEPMAPGATHKPMFDADGNYPWHQYETTTPGIIMAIEMLS